MHCGQWVLARAYIVRHKLRWNGQYVPGEGEHHTVWDPENAGWSFGMVSESYGIMGSGDSLYEAVLDYQEKSGVGWGS